MIIGEAWLAIRPEVSSVERIVGDKLKSLAGPGGPAAVAGVAIGAAIVGGLFAVGEGFEKAFNKIRSATNATDQEMKGLETSFKNVFASTPGATMTNVADTLSLIHQRTGLAGTGLEEFTRKEIELAKITKTDVNENVQVTTALFGKFGIAAKDQAADLDVLYKASLVGGKGVAALASDMTATRGVTASMGLTFNQSAALMAQFEQHGLNATQAMMALNRGMTSLGKDGGPQSQAGLDKLSKAAEAADKALEAARGSAGRAGVALFDANSKAKDTAEKGLTLAENALKNVNARLDDQRTKALAAHSVWTMSTQDALALKLAQDKVAEAQAKVASAGGGAGSGAAQRALADATSKAAAAHKALSDAQKGGATSAADIQAKLHGLFDSIKGAATEQDALNIAAANFGVRGGRELGLAIRSGALDFDTLAAKLGTGGDAIDKTTQKTLTLGEKMQVMKNRALVALEPLAVKVVDIANLIFDDLPAAWDKVSKIMEPVIGFIQHNAVPSLAALGVVAASIIIPAIIGLGSALAAFIAGPLAAMVVAAAPVVAVAAIAFGIVYAFQHVKVFHDLVIKLRDMLIATARFVIDHWKLVAAVFFPFIAIPALIITHFKVLRDILADIGSFVIDHWQLVAAVFLPIIAVPVLIITHFTQLRDMLVATARFVIDHWKLVAAAFVPIIGIPYLIVTHFRQIISFFEGLPARIVSALGSLVSALIGVFGSVFSGLVDALPGLIEGMISFFVSIPFRIIGLYIAADRWLIETGVKVLLGLVQGAVNFLPTLAGWFIELPGKILAFLELYVKAEIWLLKLGVKILTGLLNGVKDFAPELFMWFVELPGYIISAVGDIAGKMLDIGKHIIEGLINGIKSMGGAVGNALVDGVKEGAKSLLGFLGIGSPSKLYHGYGVNIMEGLANGITASAHLPMNRLLALKFPVPTITGPVGATATPSGTASIGAIAVQLDQLNRHLRDRPPQVVVNQSITASDSDTAKTTASESVRLLAAAGYRWGRK